ncbi:MAG TPA: 2,3,4,5-tetrahydropyridine-2,6-dicarboxylate N-succinyltransferase, partial [Bacteroidota bacterium]|nr:2,3,4,5-tetrahydropyridine-2,6-dicarboxylate N-succinyltransferase [Bacteroidota bacterium]
QMNRSDALEVVRELKEKLNNGEVRSAEPRNGVWTVNEWVKKGILLAFRTGSIVPFDKLPGGQFFDKDTLPLKYIGTENDIRIVPGGSAVRDGVFLGKGVVMMPPAYVNIGAYVDEHTMIDSHALVGSCAQIGKRVHLSAGAQIGGVLEPVGSLPVIIEDEVLVGGNTGIYEGAIVKRRAVIGAGVILTGSTAVYDLVNEKIYKRTEKEPLIIPSGAVVIPGSRQIDQPFAIAHKLSISSPIIVKYRDEKTDASTVLEESLRAIN